MKTKVLLILTVTLLACCCVVGGTTAWLQSQAEVVNTFALGNIYLSLTETTGSTYQLIPGATVAKDPKVTVHKDSVSCWLFVKIEEANDLDAYISYTPADGWLLLADGVYYRQQAATDADVSHSVLQNDQYTVNRELSMSQMAALKATGTYPTLTLTAYAVQQNGITTPQEAWEQVKNLY